MQLEMIDDAIVQRSGPAMGRSADGPSPDSGSGVRYWRPVPGEAPELIGAYLDGAPAALHVHEEWQFAVAGAPSALSVGAFHRFRARPGDLTVIHPYDVHTEGGTAGGPQGWWVLYVAPNVVADAYRRLCGERGERSMPRFRGPVITDPALAAELGAVLKGSADGTIGGLEFAAWALDWLERLLRRHAAATLPHRDPPAPVERVRAYLRDRPGESLTLSDVVPLAGVTTSHLVRSFARAVGLPPRRYHVQLRLARARRLLAEGKPATWVAYECGFADQSHLTRRFKDSYGLTPGAFQAQHRAGHVPEPSGRHFAGIGSNAA
jgi:AraC-like DNA-binding protein